MPNVTQNWYANKLKEQSNLPVPSSGNPYQDRQTELAIKAKNGEISWYDVYQQLLMDRQTELADFGSDYYKKFSDFLQKNTPRMGTDASLATLSAGGAGYAGAQNIAAERAKAFNVNRQEGINNAVSSFALDNQGQATSLLSALSNNNLNKMQLTQQGDAQRQQNNWGSQLLNIGATIAGTALAPATGGASLALPALTSSFGGNSPIRMGGYNPFRPNSTGYQYGGG